MWRKCIQGLFFVEWQFKLIINLQPQVFVYKLRICPWFTLISQ